jgi:hypothetical protein
MQFGDGESRSVTIGQIFLVPEGNVLKVAKSDDTMGMRKRVHLSALAPKGVQE